MKHAFALILTLVLSQPVWAGVLPDSNTITFNSEANGDYAGESVVGIGDFNGDLIPSPAISAHNYPTSYRNGAVYIPYQSLAVMPTTVELSSIGLTRPGVRILGDIYSSFGKVIERAGDNDKDGLANLLVSAPGNSTVYLIPGSKTITGRVNVSAIPHVKFLGASGNSIAVCDVNNNNLLDFLIGTGPNGEFYLVKDLTAKTGTINLSTITVFQTNAPGSEVSLACSDVKKDGYDDIIYAVNTTRGGGVVFGSQNLASSILNASFFDGIKGTAFVPDFAMQVASSGDLTFDGKEEFVVRGVRLYTQTGITKVIHSRDNWPATLDLSATTVSSDVSGLGNGKLAVAKTPSGILLGDGTTNKVVAIDRQLILPSAITTTTPKYTGTGYLGTSVAFVDNVTGGDGCGINTMDAVSAPGYGMNKAKIYFTAQ